FCPNCGVQIDANDKFCTNCGAALSDGSTTEPVVQSTQVQVQPVQQQVQSIQPIQKGQPSLNASRTVMAIKKKRFNSKVLIIAIVVVLTVAGFGFYKYRTSPAHNPNNPLANQNFTFVRDKDTGKIALSEAQVGRIDWNIYRIALKKKAPNAAATRYLINHPQSYIDGYSNQAEKLSNQAEKLEDLIAHDKKIGNIFDDIYDNYMVNKYIWISPNNRNIKNGDKVTIYMKQDKVTNSIIAKYPATNFLNQRRDNPARHDRHPSFLPEIQITSSLAAAAEIVKYFTQITTMNTENAMYSLHSDNYTVSLVKF
ncbi:zinc-ribbon domain-containing protein, partial [Lactobacillus helveticus]|uniref:zinc-ribbon domain-containing protein n=1 Tax=Lactobacillus helveticus TaxID=1587 RepID=UPI0015666E16